MTTPGDPVPGAWSSSPDPARSASPLPSPPHLAVSPPPSLAVPPPPSLAVPPPPPPPPPTPSLAAARVDPAQLLDPGDVPEHFVPLRVEPPPRLFATWWLRYLLVLAQLVGIVVVMLTEYAQPGGLVESPAVVTTYLLAACMLVCWSALAMLDAKRLVPATLYRRGSSALVAVVLWLVAFVAPVGAFRVVEWARDRFADNPDDVAVVTATIAAVLLCFVLVWTPFHYHTAQAHRIGAPVRVVAAWFWLPLIAAVGVVLANSLGLAEMLEDGGLTASERTVQVGMVFGVPALMLTLCTWRATTVIDEVIDLRWRRWRKEWEQTLAAMAAQPPPGPEGPVPLPAT